MKPAIRYFFPRQKRSEVPRQLIASYDIRTATPEQRLAMMAGKARSPKKADDLFGEYGVNTARDLLHVLPPPHKRTFKELLLSLIWRWAGHYRKKRSGYQPDRVRMDYKFK